MSGTRTRRSPIFDARAASDTSDDSSRLSRSPSPIFVFAASSALRAASASSSELLSELLSASSKSSARVAPSNDLRRLPAWPRLSACMAVFCRPPPSTGPLSSSLAKDGTATLPTRRFTDTESRGFDSRPVRDPPPMDRRPSSGGGSGCSSGVWGGSPARWSWCCIWAAATTPARPWKPWRPRDGCGLGGFGWLGGRGAVTGRWGAVTGRDDAADDASSSGSGGASSSSSALGSKLSSSSLM